MKKTIGFIGLGKMGSMMVENLLSKKYKVVAHNRSPEPVRNIAKKGAIPAYTIEELITKLQKPRIIMLMVTAGKPIDAVLKSLIPLLYNPLSSVNVYSIFPIPSIGVSFILFVLVF